MNKKKIISVTGRKKKSDSQKEYVTEKKKKNPLELKAIIIKQR